MKRKVLLACFCFWCGIISAEEVTYNQQGCQGVTNDLVYQYIHLYKQIILCASFVRILKNRFRQGKSIQIKNSTQNYVALKKLHLHTYHAATYRNIKV